jgi:hypothetical protein
MLYADEPYFRKPPRIDEQFGVVSSLVQNQSWKWKSLIFMFNGI